jgi:hypothetical protein
VAFELQKKSRNCIFRRYSSYKKTTSMNIRMKMLKSLKGFVAVALLTAACTEHDLAPETGNLTISLAVGADAGGRGNSDGREEIDAIFITITDNHDNLVEEKKVSVMNLNGTYITESITLPVGDLKVTRFLVLDDTGEVLFVTPQTRSGAVRDVEKALPLPLKVEAGKATSFHAEVLSVAGYATTYFGYPSFEFTIANPCDKVSAEIGGVQWCGHGTYLVAYGNTPPAFELWLSNKQSMVGIRVRYIGAGTYNLADSGSDYYRRGDADAHDVVSGTLVITSAPAHNHERVSGTFNLILRDGNGHTVEIKNGAFNKVRGMGY